MTATYYAIYEFNELTQKRGEIVLDGIVSDSESTICPRQETGIEHLPFECELHKFWSDKDYLGNTYRIETCNFTITREVVKQFRTTGDKIN